MIWPAVAAPQAATPDAASAAAAAIQTSCLDIPFLLAETPAPLEVFGPGVGGGFRPAVLAQVRCASSFRRRVVVLADHRTEEPGLESARGRRRARPRPPALE